MSTLLALAPLLIKHLSSKRLIVHTVCLCSLHLEAPRVLPIRTKDYRPSIPTMAQKNGGKIEKMLSAIQFVSHGGLAIDQSGIELPSSLVA